ncbi:hypothetical protein ONE63_011097 [Megalurothrips usitatus]|uniref:DUF6570 domain-containing protein n=1 Tax=Megalurothrips usitatus TaxID=439358 RepID=A0AAV7XMG2_9NEOP|nr:hypothetical protein ONE63_011097 [Megalurothrips usitatus]
MDPGEQPPELKGLTFIEEQLIARISPVLSVFKLKGHQFGYTGNVINFSQDIKQLAKKLPHRLEDLSSVITVRAGSEIKPVEFQIRAEKVRTALQFLINNNPHHFDVEINEENLKLLPEDGNYYDKVRSYDLQEDDENLDDSTCGSDSEDEENYASVIESGVPMVGKPTESAQLQTVLEWPPREKAPVNGFTMLGYVCMAFPCLFPYGKADLNSPREKPVSALNYFKHLMRFHDDRFAQHPRFRYFALNSLMRWSALKDGNVFIQNHPEYKDMTAADLKELVQNDPNVLKK